MVVNKKRIRRIQIMVENENKNRNGIPLIKCLTACGKGEEITIVSVNAGSKAKHRLANLGLVPGVSIIKKKSAPMRGPLEIIVKGTSLVIGRGLASKIMVKCSGSCPF